MSKQRKIRSFFRKCGWGSAIAGVVWGALFYWRFHNPVVDAFHDVPAQLRALQAEANIWQAVGLAIIAFACISFGIGYLGRSPKIEPEFVEEPAKAETKNIVEGT